MRLRAEYLFSEKNYDSIRFMDYSGKWYNWTGNNQREKFENYLQQVFGWCGSASLEKQLSPVKNFKEIIVGDVLVSGGFPGLAKTRRNLKTGDKSLRLCGTLLSLREIIYFLSKTISYENCCSKPFGPASGFEIKNLFCIDWERILPMSRSSSSNRNSFTKLL